MELTDNALDQIVPQTETAPEASRVEKRHLVTAIARCSDLSLAEAASAVEFVLRAMHAERGLRLIPEKRVEEGMAESHRLPLLEWPKGHEQLELKID